MTEGPGVLGNLPRSRPGRRSAKRGSAAQPAAKPAPRRATTRVKPKPRPAQTAGRTGRQSSRASRPAASRPPVRASSPGRGDPVTQAVKIAVKVTEVGIRAAGGILRRLPGP